MCFCLCLMEVVVSLHKEVYPLEWASSGKDLGTKWGDHLWGET